MLKIVERYMVGPYRTAVYEHLCVPACLLRILLCVSLKVQAPRMYLFLWLHTSSLPLPMRSVPRSTSTALNSSPDHPEPCRSAKFFKSCKKHACIRPHTTPTQGGLLADMRQEFVVFVFHLPGEHSRHIHELIPEHPGGVSQIGFNTR